MAEIFSHIMTLSPEKLKEISELDQILRNKITFIKSRILIIDKNFKFPGNMKVTTN